MADTAEYETTERAGRRVAGHVVTGAGQILALTEDQAEHALLEGTIVPKGKTVHKSYTEDTKRLAGMRAEADALRARTEPPPSVPEEPEAAEEPASPRGKAKANAGADDALKGA